MLYQVIIEQEGDGCDYTIGCGTRVLEFERNATPNEVLAEVQQALLGEKNRLHGDLEDIAHHLRDGEIRTIQVTQVVGQLDLKLVRAELRKVDAAARRQAAEAAERAEYERLRRKFEGGRK